VNERENEAIAQYQHKIERRAGEREASVKKTYIKIYAVYISDFDKVLDKEPIADIKNFVQDASELFTNTLRNEVNAKVNSSYLPWKQLVSCHPSQKQLQDYCNKVYKEADNNLLDLLKAAILDTNKYIEKVTLYDNTLISA